MARPDRPPRAARLRRGGLAHALVLLAGLVATGSLYSLLVPQPRDATAAAGPAGSRTAAPGRLEAGARLYRDTCMGCHGTDLRGVPDRGPSLIGAGEAAVYFQVSTGRMPRARGGTDDGTGAMRGPRAPEYDTGTPEGRRNLRALGAYVQAHGGGPRRPDEHGEALVGDDPANGGELFRANCATCHNFTGRGGVLPDRRFAPRISPATPEQMYTAMLTGPQSMPVFGDRHITPEQKKDVIAYLLATRGQRNAAGGYNLGEIGPVSEGFVAFVVGLAAMFAFALWLGNRL